MSIVCGRSVRPYFHLINVYSLCVCILTDPLTCRFVYIVCILRYTLVVYCCIHCMYTTIYSSCYAGVQPLGKGTPLDIHQTQYYDHHTQTPQRRL